MDQSAHQVIAPLLNPNEPDAKVVSLLVQEGQYITKDSVLCTLETTKSTAEVVAEVDGYVVGLQISEEDLVQAGSLICYLAEQQEWNPEFLEKSTVDPQTSSDFLPTGIPEGLRITQPALKIAAENQVDLSKLPIGPLLTEKAIIELIEGSDKPTAPDMVFNPYQVIIYGGGGHGKSVIDLIRSQSRFHIYGILDDGLTSGDHVLDVPVLGGAEVLQELHDRGIRQAVNAVGGIGDINSRINISNLITKHGFTCPTIIHSSADVELSAELSAGIQVFAQAYIGSQAHLGFGVIVNTGAVVSHDCILEDFANLSPGALLAGGVKIGKSTLVGMGVTINLGVSVGENVRIGNGATIKSDVPDGSRVRAGTIWPK